MAADSENALSAFSSQEEGEWWGGEKSRKEEGLTF